MPKFVVVRGRDAWIIEEAIIEADSLAEAEDNASWKHNARQLNWVQVGDVRVFDNTEIMEGEARPYNKKDAPIERVTLHVTPAERDTILAALRFWKWDIYGESPDNAMLGDIATNGGEHEALTGDEIDDLCEAINV